VSRGSVERGRNRSSHRAGTSTNSIQATEPFLNSVPTRAGMVHQPSLARQWRELKTFPVTPRLYSGCAGRGVDRSGKALVRERQPAEELARRFIGRLAIKGHHGSRYPRSAAQLRPPPVADGRHLYLVRAPANGFFKVMNDHVSVVRRRLRAATILFAAAPGSSEATREGRVHNQKRRVLFASRAEIIIASPVLHSFCTCRAQVFHNPVQSPQWRRG
jgi:hypothetical protein